MRKFPNEQPPTPAPATSVAFVEAIYVAPTAAGTVQRVREACAVAGRGLEGDRYFEGAGTFSSTPGTGRHLTIIDSAALDALEREHGIHLEPGATRRNLITRGVDLAGLVGRRFWVGEVLCEGMRPCPPCGHLEALTQPGVARGLVERGGVRVDIRQDGTIHVGDTIRLAE